MRTQELAAKLKKYYVPIWAPPEDFAVAGGKGPYLIDPQGRKYIDFVGGIAVNALGYCHPELTKAFRECTLRPHHVSSLYMQEDRVRLAELLVKNSFADKVFFCNSGTEAIEAAIKFMRKWASTHFGAEKRTVLTFRNGFHGRTYGALSATAQEKFHAGFEPLVPGFCYLEPNDLAAFDQAANEKTVCGVLVEPVQAEGGILPCNREWLQAVRRICSDRKILLAFDEIQTGMGRCGALWAHRLFGVEPDLMCLAKALGGGIPFGATLVKAEIADCLRVGDHGNTTGGSPVAAHLGLAVMKCLLRASFMKRVQKASLVLKKELLRLCGEFPDKVGGIRGTGMLQGLVLKVDVAGTVNACRRNGLLVCKAGSDVLRMLPPLNVEGKVIRKAVDILRGVLANTDERGSA